MFLNHGRLAYFVEKTQWSSAACLPSGDEDRFCEGARMVSAPKAQWNLESSLFQAEKDAPSYVFSIFAYADAVTL